MSQAPAAPQKSAVPPAHSRPPTALERGFDNFFRRLTWVVSWLSVALLVFFIMEIGSRAMPAITQHGASLLTSTEWAPSEGEYGILPHIWGTVFSSLLGLFIGSVLGVAVAIFLTEDFLPPKWRGVLKNIVELLAAIPSVIYGLWGIYVVIPALKGPADWLHHNLGWVPFFSTSFGGPGMLPAALVLAIMILPTVTALSRDAIASVPPRLREGAIGLGATRWETILKITLPTASAGIFGAIILGFGRALGETMALAMLVGNRPDISWSILAPGHTLAALLANNFREAVTDPPQVAALMYAALVLMLITLAVNVLGSLVIWRASSKLKGLR